MNATDTTTRTVARLRSEGARQRWKRAKGFVGQSARKRVIKRATARAERKASRRILRTV